MNFQILFTTTVILLPTFAANILCSLPKEEQTESFALACPRLPPSLLLQRGFSVRWVLNGEEQLRFEAKDSIHQNRSLKIHYLTPRGERIGKNSPFSKLTLLSEDQNRRFDFDGRQLFTMFVRNVSARDTGVWRCEIDFFGVYSGKDDGLLRAESMKILAFRPSREKTRNKASNETESGKPTGSSSKEVHFFRGEEANLKPSSSSGHLSLLNEEAIKNERKRKKKGATKNFFSLKAVEDKNSTPWIRDLVDLEQYLRRLSKKNDYYQRVPKSGKDGDGYTVFERVNARSDVAYTRNDADSVEFNRQGFWETVDEDRAHRESGGVNVQTNVRMRRRYKNGGGVEGNHLQNGTHRHSLFPTLPFFVLFFVQFLHFPFALFKFT